MEMIFQTRSGERRERNLKTLKEVHVGETVKVQKLTGEGPVKRRIMDMGITKGVEIYVRKVAPLGDPVEVTVRGYELSLRKADAEMIVLLRLFAPQLFRHWQFSVMLNGKNQTQSRSRNQLPPR